jgi:uncharacterized membrane protein
MKSWSSRQRLWAYRATGLLFTAIAVHLLAVWATPRLIMHRVMNAPMVTDLKPTRGAVFSPAVDATSRRVVMPSPDLLYSLCVFDLSQGPLRITARPALDTYWSVALYADNSDNFFVQNDRQTGKSALDLWLVSEGANASAPAVPAGARVVVSPSRRGLLLMRVLTADYEAEKALLEPARRTLQCVPA